MVILSISRVSNGFREEDFFKSSYKSMGATC